MSQSPMPINLAHLRNEATNSDDMPVTEMAPGLYLLDGFGNVGIAITGEGVVLVDTGRPADPNAVLGRLRRLTDEPVKYIIYTHGQADHAANAGPILQEAAKRGDARPTIIAHSRVTARMNRYAEMYGYTAFINRLQFRVPPNYPSFPPNEKFIRPDLTYEDSMKFRLGNLTFELYHAMGETDDITWVFVPEHKAVFSGDLYISSCPNVGNPLKIQRYELEWAEALERIASFKPAVLGPGHGAVLRGEQLEDYLLTTARSLRYLHDEVVRRMNLGQWEEQIFQEVELPPELANHPAMAPVYGCPYFIVRATYRRYGGWYDGNPSHLKPARTGEIAAEVVKLTGEQALLERAASLSEAGQYQLALHLLDYVIDGSADPQLAVEARRRKSTNLKKLAASETSFISASILNISADRILAEIEEAP